VSSFIVVIHQHEQPLSRSHQSHLHRGIRDASRDGRLVDCLPATDDEQQRLTFGVRKPSDGGPQPRSLVVGDGGPLRVRPWVTVVQQVFQRQQQAAPEQRAPDPALRDGEYERIWIRGRSRRQPALGERREALLGDFLTETRIAHVPGAVPDDPRGQIAQGGFQVHSNEVPQPGVWSHTLVPDVGRGPVARAAGKRGRPSRLGWLVSRSPSAVLPLKDGIDVSGGECPEELREVGCHSIPP
jgi:hypothetical protein